MSEYARERQIKDNYTDRLSLAQCREILHAEEMGYSDQEVLLIRDFLYSLAVVDYNYHERQAKRKADIIKLSTDEHHNATKGDPVFSRKYRRTG